MHTVIKKRTREEILSAVRQSIERKREWQERAKKDIQNIRKERMRLNMAGA